MLASKLVLNLRESVQPVRGRSCGSGLHAGSQPLLLKGVSVHGGLQPGPTSPLTSGALSLPQGE